MRIMVSLLLAALLTAPCFVLAETRVGVNINVGLPAPPLPGLPRITFEVPPLFLAPPSLGFYVGVDMPHDLVLVSGNYYLFQGNHWYRASHYNGPWTSTRYEQLPQQIRRYKVENIRYHRDHEYRSYHDDRDHYRGKHYRPAKEGKQYRKEEKRWEKEERKHHKGKHGRDDD
ncbi:MAG: hypothetical protein WBI04_05490 [Trichlorobacter sp.]|jgi:hypothetical protein